LPIVLGAGLKTFLDLNLHDFTPQAWYLFILGIVVSAFTGFLVIKFFLRFLEKRSLRIFAAYRIILGIALIIWFLRITY
jgi:undecaprenyl-diphosphatase